MSVTKSVPKVDFAFIGGSGTRECRFPEELADPAVAVLEDNLVFGTSLGRSAKFKLLHIKQDEERGYKEKQVLFARYHGWQTFATHFADQEKVFWVFEQAGVKRILADGTVGGVNHLLEPGDVVVPHDFIDNRTNTSKLFQEGKLVRFRRALCPELRQVLVAAAQEVGFRRVFRRGVCGVTEGPRFETPAEVAMFKVLGADIVGQSLCPEAYLARSIGACYAGMYRVTNYAEGLVEDWTQGDLWEQYSPDSAQRMAKATLRALGQLDLPVACGCQGDCTVRPPHVLRFPDM
ncbi:MAG: MTAP family purine nucleoside phosphorylase [Chloroflexi bacterium]|nr:MTAP family purine nucleoside phosphorylase [Chloroflexota bacterium]